MANKNDLFDFDETTAVNNDNVQGANIAENCAPSGINNAIRGLAAIVKRAIGSQGSAIASAATTAIGASGTAFYTTITGTTPITSFGSVGAGTLRIVEFTGVLTLTHNATSLKLPGSANITTAAGDVGYFVSLGSGNWKCLHYSKADGSAVTNFGGTLTSSDAGPAEGPDFIADRNSASPAASDVIGGLVLRGRDSGGNATDYARLRAVITDPTNGSEDAQAIISAFIAGTETDILRIGPGARIGAPTGGDKGVGTLNAAAGLYVAGHGTIAQVVSNTNTTWTTCGTIIPGDNTIPQITEGDEILSVAITPTNAGSTLRITVSLPVVGGAGSVVATAALFVDATVNALAVGTSQVVTAGNVSSLRFEHEVSAGSTSSRTYRVRLGGWTATDVFLNGDNASRLFGGVAQAILTVEEILPQ